jgi:hypothetical protein
MTTEIAGAGILSLDMDYRRSLWVKEPVRRVLSVFLGAVCGWVEKLSEFNSSKVQPALRAYSTTDFLLVSLTLNS